MKARALVLLLAIAFLASPALAAVPSSDCVTDCPTQIADEPCESGSGCAAVAAVSCCDLAPIGVPVKRATDESGPSGGVVLRATTLVEPPCADAIRFPAPIAQQSHSLRFSVVLRI